MSSATRATSVVRAHACTRSSASLLGQSLGSKAAPLSALCPASHVRAPVPGVSQQHCHLPQIRYAMLENQSGAP